MLADVLSFHPRFCCIPLPVWPPTWKDAEAALSACGHWFYDPPAPDKLQRHSTGCVANESQSSSSGPWLHLNELSERGKKTKAVSSHLGWKRSLLPVCGRCVWELTWGQGLSTTLERGACSSGKEYSISGWLWENQQTQRQGQETALWDLLSRKASEWNGWLCDRFVVARFFNAIKHRLAHKNAVIFIQMINSTDKYDDIVGTFKKSKQKQTAYAAFSCACFFEQLDLAEADSPEKLLIKVIPETRLVWLPQWIWVVTATIPVYNGTTISMLDRFEIVGAIKTVLTLSLSCFVTFGSTYTALSMLQTRNGRQAHWQERIKSVIRKITRERFI